MPTKLGFHLSAGIPLERLRDAPPAAIMIQDDVTLMNSAYDTIGAGPLYIFRQSALGDAQSFIQASGGVTKAVEKFLQIIEPAARNLYWAYHSTLKAQQITDEIAQFDALAIELARERFGVRLCVGNFATETTPDWSRYRPALDAAARNNALIGVREYYPVFPYVGYGPNTNIPNKTLPSRKLANEVQYPQGYQQPGLLVGRYRHLRDYCRQQQLPVQIVITESGAGKVLEDWLNSFGSNLSGWNTLAPVWQRLGLADAQTRYFQDLNWLDQHVYNADPEVLAVCVYGWKAEAAYDIGGATKLLDLLQNYLKATRPAPRYVEKALPAPSQFRVTTTRVRIRAIPTMNTKFTGNIENGETFSATHYTFYDGYLWLKHSRGWSAYAPLVNGNPDYDKKLLDGLIITTPRQDGAVNNFVATLSEVRSFLQAHQGQMFYIAINPGVTPNGARRFSITTFPVEQGRRILDQLHPQPGNPRMSPEAKKRLIDAGQL